MPGEAGAGTGAQIGYIFQLLASRQPTTRETRALSALYNDQKLTYSREPEAAAQLIHIGESKPDPKLLSIDLAAMTVVAQTVLNLDAAVWKR
jgi:hypothetical protein